MGLIKLRKVVNSREVTDGTSIGGGEQRASTTSVGDCLSKYNGIYFLWVLVEKHNRRNLRDYRKIDAVINRKLAVKSRFNVLENLNEMENLQEKRHGGDLVNNINGARLVYFFKI